MARIVISMGYKEKQALIGLAQGQLREPGDQARLIIRAELVRLGLISPEESLSSAPDSSDKGTEIPDTVVRNEQN